MTDKIRVLIVDDHQVVRLGLVSLVGGEPDMVVVGEAQTGEQALDQFRALQPDVTLMDIRIPRPDGIEVIRRLRAEFPDARLIAISTHEGDEHVHQALAAGALGYIFKKLPADEVLAAIRAAHRRRRYVPAEVAIKLAERAGQSELTAREKEVLQQVAEGLENEEIADELGIAAGTVKIHLKSIFAKLDVHDRTHATAVALRRGLVHFES